MPTAAGAFQYLCCYLTVLMLCHVHHDRLRQRSVYFGGGLGIDNDRVARAVANATKLHLAPPVIASYIRNGDLRTIAQMQLSISTRRATRCVIMHFYHAASTFTMTIYAAQKWHECQRFLNHKGGMQASSDSRNELEKDIRVGMKVETHIQVPQA